MSKEIWDIDGRQVEVRVTAYVSGRLPMFQFATKGARGWLMTNAHQGQATAGQAQHESLLRFAIKQGALA